MVFKFISKQSAEVEAFEQSLTQHLVHPFEFQFTEDLTEVALQEHIASSPASVSVRANCHHPSVVRIIVTDQTTIKLFADIGLHGLQSVMCGHSDQDALQAFNAGVSMFFCLSASEDVKSKQIQRLTLTYQSHVQALKRRAVSELLAQQRACSPSRLMAELTQLKSNCSPPSHQIALRCGVDWQYIDCQAIRYVEAAGDYMCVYTHEGTLIVRSTLTAMARRLPTPVFTKVNRSIIVNTQFVKRLITLNSRVNYVELQDGSKVKISRRLMPVCHQQINAVLGEN